jgi:hypothetical protein
VKVKEKVGGVTIGTIFNGRGEHTFRFAATKVPRHCPLVLLVKVGSVKVKERARRESRGSSDRH